METCLNEIHIVYLWKWRNETYVLNRRLESLKVDGYDPPPPHMMAPKQSPLGDTEFDMPAAHAWSC
jgi:hypothetical protein